VEIIVHEGDMKQIQSIVLFLSLIAPVSALARHIEPGWYVGGGVGASRPTEGFAHKRRHSESNNILFIVSPVFNASAGYKIAKFFRADLNGQYRMMRMGDETYRQVNLTCASLMANVYLDGDNYSIVTPYVTAGFGFNSMSANDKVRPASFKNNNILQRAYNIGAGMTVKLDDNFAVDLAYRYIDLGTLKIRAKTDPTLARRSRIGLHEASINALILL
jgi:opacity protein-like surface antigen